MTPNEQEQALVLAYLGDTVGAFVDVGVNHPCHGSQTWPLAQRGWCGIVIEPQRKFQEALRQLRPESLVVRAACTSPERAGRLTLHIPSDLDHFATVEPDKDDGDLVFDAAELVDGKTLDRIITEWRAAGHAEPLRFVSIDVEGHELEVLQGFSLEIHRPDLILIEDKLQDLSKHRYLVANGYRLVRRTCLNNWYIPEGAVPPPRSLAEQAKLFRKVYLGLPFRALRRWRARRRQRHQSAPVRR